MLKIAVFVSGGGTNLQALIDAQTENRLGGGEIVLVLSSKKNVYALERAANAGIPSVVVPRRDYPDEIDFSKALEAALEDCKPDLIVYAGFLSIVSADFLKKYPCVINVHPALIPSFCGRGMYGLRVHEAALARGVKVSGATVHFVNATPDGGPIILQKAVPVHDDDTPETLQRRIMTQCEQELLPKAVQMICTGEIFCPT